MDTGGLVLFSGDEASRENGQGGMAAYKSLVLIIVLALFQGGAYGQERGLLLVEEIEKLLRAGVTPRRMATLIEEHGVSFEVTEEVRERLRKAGADDVVMQAVEKAGVEFARKRLEEERSRAEEERRKLEEERKQAEERRKAEEEARRKAEEERQRLAAEKALLEERKKLEAERQVLEEQRKRLQSTQRPSEVAALPPPREEETAVRIAYRRLQDRFANTFDAQVVKYFSVSCGGGAVTLLIPTEPYGPPIGCFIFRLVDGFRLRTKQAHFQDDQCVRSPHGCGSPTGATFFADWALSDIDLSLRASGFLGLGLSHRIIIRLKTGEEYWTGSMDNDVAEKAFQILRESQELAARAQ